MPDVRLDPRRPVDPAINSPGREGLTGTAPANLYAPGSEREQITIAPDFAPADAQPAWRQDFPIDWPQDLYVERRDFMKFWASCGSGSRTGIAGRAGNSRSGASRASTMWPSVPPSSSPTLTNTTRACWCG